MAVWVRGEDLSYYSEPLPEVLRQEGSLSHENKRFGCFLLVKGCLLIVILIFVINKLYGQRIYINVLNRLEVGHAYIQQVREDINSYMEKTLGKLTKFGAAKSNIR